MDGKSTISIVNELLGKGGDEQANEAGQDRGDDNSKEYDVMCNFMTSASQQNGDDVVLFCRIQYSRYFSFDFFNL